MLSHLIDPAILGFILIGVMLFAIFIGFIKNIIGKHAKQTTDDCFN